MADHSPANMAELLSDIEGEWKALHAVVGKLTPTQMTKADAGGWSPKDNLAHLSAWLVALMDYHMEGRPIEQALDLPRGRKQPWDDDSVNAVLFERNRDRPSEDILSELNRVYMQLTARLRATPFDDLLKKNSGFPQGKTLLAYVIANTADHFAEHRATIEKAL